MGDLQAAVSVSSDTVAGNILSKSGKPVDLAATLGNAEKDKDGIDNQSATKYGNSLNGTSANDTLAGDVLAAAAGNITITALVGKGGEVSGYDDPIKAGKGGDSNRLFAFNDFASGRGGRDVIAGDVYATEKGEINL